MYIYIYIYICIYIYTHIHTHTGRAVNSILQLRKSASFESLDPESQKLGLAWAQQKP